LNIQLFHITQYSIFILVFLGGVVNIPLSFRGNQKNRTLYRDPARRLNIEP